jgi:hypothetical protein
MKFKQTVLCSRTRGFWYGYHAQTGSEADCYDREFVRGWHEGFDLLFEERRAYAEYTDRIARRRKMP